jgi:hypothetical protein
MEIGVEMRSPVSSARGFSLIEAVMALGVLTVGMLGAAQILTQGMDRLASSPGDVVVTQKANEAIEAVFSARDSHKLTWAQIRNVKGASGNDGGVFLDGLQQLKALGADGLVNTSDDGAIETVDLPGRDQMLGTADDEVITLSGYTREIKIRDVPNEPLGCGVGPDPCMLRSVTVTVIYLVNNSKRTYTLTTYISNYA